MAAPSTNVPVHMAMIMDGNGRWARQRGLPRLKGHEAGAQTVREVMRYCRDAGVRYLTLYAFSTENWTRPRAEIAGLMALLRRFLKSNEDELHAHRVRLRMIGRREDLDPTIRREIERVEAATAAYDAGNLILALSYSGRSELARAARLIATRAARGELDPETVNEETVAAHLYAPEVPDPDLIVRTSGELRLSNFLLWQAAYSEIYVTPVLWPDFREPDFLAALKAFSGRERRFGRVQDEDGGTPR
jgi:undecaprenyl diphosphate synthase